MTGNTRQGLGLMALGVLLALLGFGTATLGQGGDLEAVTGILLMLGFLAAVFGLAKVVIDLLTPQRGRF